jgi:hypothetical protein
VEFAKTQRLQTLIWKAGRVGERLPKTPHIPFLPQIAPDIESLAPHQLIVSGSDFLGVEADRDATQKPTSSTALQSVLWKRLRFEPGARPGRCQTRKPGLHASDGARSPCVANDESGAPAAITIRARIRMQFFASLAARQMRDAFFFIARNRGLWNNSRP